MESKRDGEGMDIHTLTPRQMTVTLKAITITLDIDDIRRRDGRGDDCCLTMSETLSLRQVVAKLTQALRSSGG